MSWQLGAFTVLAVALVGGFAWYERSRPDARILALVATLAAHAPGMLQLKSSARPERNPVSKEDTVSFMGAFREADAGISKSSGRSKTPYS